MEGAANDAASNQGDLVKEKCAALTAPAITSEAAAAPAGQAIKEGSLKKAPGRRKGRNVIDARHGSAAEDVERTAGEFKSEVRGQRSEVETGRRMGAGELYFYRSQAEWIRDEGSLTIIEKGRQEGFSYAHSYKVVRRAAQRNARDEWVVSRDEVQAKQFILYCKRWANVLKYAAEDLGEQALMAQDGKSFQVQVLRFASGANIYALSSNPDAIVGKTGHVTLDEFALHKDQRTLYAVAKPVTQWGGTLAVISTHRGVGTVFNQIIRDIRERGNPMGWSLHSVPIQKAVEEGLVEKIDQVTGGKLTEQWEKSQANGGTRIGLREWWLGKQRAECIDEEQWLQEYCCVPADESTAFISYEMITAAETEECHRDLEYLKACPNPLYIGWDVARKGDLSVIDVEEQAGDVMWERMRIEMRNKKYVEMREEFDRLMGLPAVRRACIDATGLGNETAERAVERWGYRAEAVTFTGTVKQDLAYPLRMAHEDRKIRYPRDERLRADLRGVKKEVTAAGNVRFEGETGDSHCDRFWAKALAVHASGRRAEFSSALI
jgi:phage FluMu gp28-like protein